MADSSWYAKGNRTREFLVTRDLTPEEFGWLPVPIFKGTLVFEFRGSTYGCISPGGLAVTTKRGSVDALSDDYVPFVEVPFDALLEVTRES